MIGARHVSYRPSPPSRLCASLETRKRACRTPPPTSRIETPFDGPFDFFFQNGDFLFRPIDGERKPTANVVARPGIGGNDAQTEADLKRIDLLPQHGTVGARAAAKHGDA